MIGHGAMQFTPRSLPRRKKKHIFSVLYKNTFNIYEHNILEKAVLIQVIKHFCGRLYFEKIFLYVFDILMYFLVSKQTTKQFY